MVRGGPVSGELLAPTMPWPSRRGIRLRSDGDRARSRITGLSLTPKLVVMPAGHIRGEPRSGGGRSLVFDRVHVCVLRVGRAGVFAAPLVSPGGCACRPAPPPPLRAGRTGTPARTERWRQVAGGGVPDGAVVLFPSVRPPRRVRPRVGPAVTDGTCDVGAGDRPAVVPAEENAGREFVEVPCLAANARYAVPGDAGHLRRPRAPPFRAAPGRRPSRAWSATRSCARPPPPARWPCPGAARRAPGAVSGAHRPVRGGVRSPEPGSPGRRGRARSGAEPGGSGGGSAHLPAVTAPSPIGPADPVRRRPP